MYDLFHEEEEEKRAQIKSTTSYSFYNEIKIQLENF